jgi:hypothetical protein
MGVTVDTDDKHVSAKDEADHGEAAQAPKPRRWLPPSFLAFMPTSNCR